jgi:hypothetical protein
LGVVTDQIAAESLLRVVKENCKRLGILRLLSECEGLNLPFQSTSLRRFLKTKKGEFTLDFDRYLRALLQNAGISLRELKPLRSRLTQLEAQYADTADTELIHGKDATCIIEAALLKCGVREEEGRRLLWCSFEARLVEPGSTLASVLAFVRAGGVGS